MIRKQNGKDSQTPKRLKVLRVLAFLVLSSILLLALLGVATSLFGDSQRFDKAKTMCQDELWTIRNDSSFTHVKDIKVVVKYVATNKAANFKLSVTPRSCSTDMSGAAID